MAKAKVTAKTVKNISQINRAPLPIMSGLRDVMASTAHSEDKLNQIVNHIAAQMGVDVCSIYLMRAGEVLELFASKGLDNTAIRNTRLKIGEGLVGYAAEHACPINVDDAQSSPLFAARPETGEDAFKSLCAVPILREQKVRGVLVIQSKDSTKFSQAVIETLQTIAMVLAEFIASGEIISRTEMEMTLRPYAKPTQMNGEIFSKGLVMAKAFVHNAPTAVKRIIANDKRLEKKRLRMAIVSMNKAIQKMLSPLEDQSNVREDTREILESYQLFANDEGWLKKIEGMIDEGLTADAAVQRAQAEIRARFQGMASEVLQDKAHDIDDISSRLISAMSPQDVESVTAQKRPDKFILVAGSLSAAALFEYGLDHIAGIILTGGSPSGHVSIIAKALEIPMIGQCADALSCIRSDDTLILDAKNGIVQINPSDYVCDLYKKQIKSQNRKQKRYKKNKDIPAVTKDGQKISMLMNAGMIAEMPLLHESGAAGIGLFRTELSFMGRKKYPFVSEQAQLYGQIMDQAEGRPITFRTLDIGGDKPLPYFDSPHEENPAMGWRAMRIILDRPAVLRTQIRAMIMGANGRPLRVLLPFVSEVAEVDQAKKLIDMEFDRAKKRGIPLPSKFELGVMIEVPSLVWELESLMHRIQFVAVGTNDLMQYLFASDSRSDMVRDRYDCLSPAMLKVLNRIAQVCKDHNVDASVCGEMASKPLEAMVLTALGFTSLSMPVRSMGQVKDAINTMDTKKTMAYIDTLLNSGAHTLRRKIESFAKDHKVKI
jgi:phosphotransferase system enzyme I (PtsP)